MQSKIGTVDVFVERNQTAARPDLQWIVTHREKIRGGVRVVAFFGEIPDVAIEKMKQSGRKLPDEYAIKGNQTIESDAAGS